MSSEHNNPLLGGLAWAGIAVTVLCALYMAYPAAGAGSISITFVLFIAWALLPYGLLLRWARRPLGAVLIQRIRVATALLVVLGGSVALVQTAFVERDAQGGLLFIFLPIYQWFVLSGTALVVWLLDSR